MTPNDRFCSSCAASLETKEVAGRGRPSCPECGRVVFYDPKVAAICIVERGDTLLLVRRGNEPGYGLWSLPGGYVDRARWWKKPLSEKYGKRPGWTWK